MHWICDNPSDGHATYIYMTHIAPRLMFVFGDIRLSINQPFVEVNSLKAFMFVILIY